MLLTDEDITRSIVWLCESATPPVKYLTEEREKGGGLLSALAEPRPADSL